MCARRTHKPPAWLALLLLGLSALPAPTVHARRAIAFVQDKANAAGTGTSVQVTLDATATVGNGLVCGCRSNAGDDVTLSDDASNTWTERRLTNNAGDARVEQWSAPVVNASTDVITCSSGTNGVHHVACIELSGVDLTVTGTPNGATADASTGPLAVGSVTPADADSVLMANIGFSATASGLGIGDSYILNADATTARSGLAYRIVSSAAAYNPQFDWTESLGAATAHVAYKQAAAGGAVPCYMMLLRVGRC